MFSKNEVKVNMGDLVRKHQILLFRKKREFVN